MKRILIEVGHPNDVHQFLSLGRLLESCGITVFFAAKGKDITQELLISHGVKFASLGATPRSMWMKIVTIPWFAFRLFMISSRFKPDLYLSRVSLSSGIVSLVKRKQHIGFADTENMGLLDIVSVPLTDYIMTSESYKKDFGQKHIRYNGYIETWYLHPNRFTPDQSVLQKLDVSDGQRYAILRFVSWEAHHDRGLQGVSFENKLKLVNELSKHLKVFISSEKPLPRELQKYQYNIDPSCMHSALFYAHLYFGESATMASECAMLGTPAIFLDPVGRGYTDEQEERFGLVHNYSTSPEDQLQAIHHAVKMASNCELKKAYSDLHARMIACVDDVTQIVSQFILSKLHQQRET